VYLVQSRDKKKQSIRFNINVGQGVAGWVNVVKTGRGFKRRRATGMGGKTIEIEELARRGRTTWLSKGTLIKHPGRSTGGNLHERSVADPSSDESTTPFGRRRGGV